MVTLAFANLRTMFYSNVFEVLTCHYDDASHQRSGSSKNVNLRRVDFFHLCDLRDSDRDSEPSN